MTEKTLSVLSASSRTLAALRELLSALDRRAPHVDRTEEISIANDAQALRREAVTRIEELTRTESGDAAYDEAQRQAIMTDDGAPSPASARDTLPAI